MKVFVRALRSKKYTGIREELDIDKIEQNANKVQEIGDDRAAFFPKNRLPSLFDLNLIQV